MGAFMPNTQTVPLIDVTTIPHAERHATIFAVLTALQPGGLMQITNDHDPRPLHFQIENRWPDQFLWRYIEQGPDVWHVEIKRR
jgi:uncharacterized protein (DUF2249 family)